MTFGGRGDDDGPAVEQGRRDVGVGPKHLRHSKTERPGSIIIIVISIPHELLFSCFFFPASPFFSCVYAITSSEWNFPSPTSNTREKMTQPQLTEHRF